ncbi:MAG: hypothetical protein GY758_03805 [Fuerstiella sp.]|nr:hypothetical protein [Fuerstiella sp.]
MDSIGGWLVERRQTDTEMKTWHQKSIQVCDHQDLSGPVSGLKASIFDKLLSVDDSVLTVFRGWDGGQHACAVSMKRKAEQV